MTKETEKQAFISGAEWILKELDDALGSGGTARSMDIKLIPIKDKLNQIKKMNKETKNKQLEVILERFDKMFDHYNPIHDTSEHIPPWYGSDYQAIKQFIETEFNNYF